MVARSWRGRTRTPPPGAAVAGATVADWPVADQCAAGAMDRPEWWGTSVHLVARLRQWWCLVDAERDGEVASPTDSQRFDPGSPPDVLLRRGVRFRRRPCRQRPSRQRAVRRRPAYQCGSRRRCHWRCGTGYASARRARRRRGHHAAARVVRMVRMPACTSTAPRSPRLARESVARPDKSHRVSNRGRVEQVAATNWPASWMTGPRAPGLGGRAERRVVWLPSSLVAWLREPVNEAFRLPVRTAASP